MQGKLLSHFQDIQHLWKRHSGPLVQALLADPSNGMENFGVWITMHAKGLRSHAGRTGKLLGADDRRRCAMLLKH